MGYGIGHTTECGRVNGTQVCIVCPEASRGGSHSTGETGRCWHSRGILPCMRQVHKSKWGQNASTKCWSKLLASGRRGYYIPLDWFSLNRKDRATFCWCITQHVTLQMTPSYANMGTEVITGNFFTLVKLLGSRKQKTLSELWNVWQYKFQTQLKITDGNLLLHRGIMFTAH